MNEVEQEIQMFILLWETKQKKWEFFPVDVPCKPKRGPRDKYLVVKGCRVKPNEDGHFINNGYTDVDRDAVHTFAVARLTIELWEKALGQQIKWPWVNFLITPRLKIDLFDPLTEAMYKRDERSIIFGTYGPDKKLTRRSFDIVAHETTHAIIYALRKLMAKEIYREEKPLVESLCDVSSILLSFSYPGLIEKALLETSQDLTKPNFISEFAEGYGCDGISGIRSALRYDRSNSDSCSKGSLITYTIYKKIVDIWNETKNYGQFYPLFDTFKKAILSPIISLEALTLRNYLNILAPLVYFIRS